MSFDEAQSRLSVGLEGTTMEHENNNCKKCGGAMKPGKAIEQTWTGIPDFPGDVRCVTMSPGGAGKLIDCVKCEECGWSMTSNAELMGASRIHGEASLSNDVLGAVRPGKELK